MLGGRSFEEQIQNLQSVYQQYQVLNNEVQNEYSQQVIRKQQTQKRYQRLNQTRDILSNKIAQTLQQINSQLKKNISIKTEQLQMVKNKHQRKNKNAQLIRQNQYFFKIPKIKFDIKSIQVPEGINSVIKQFENQFQYQKNALQNQITKLKILIKLAQMNKKQDIKQIPSKSRKNQ